MKKQSFEDFVRSKCPDILQTNNSSEGEDRWVENLDGSEYEELGQEYGELMYKQGQDDYRYPKITKVALPDVLDEHCGHEDTLIELNNHED